MDIWRRGPQDPAVLCPLFPRAWHFEECLQSLLHCAQLLCPGHFILQASHMQNLCLPFLESVWSLVPLTRCPLVWLWHETCHYSARTEALQTPTSGNMVLERFWAILGKGAHHAGDWSKAWLERADPPGDSGKGLGLSKLGSKCLGCVLSYQWLCAYAVG